MRGAVIADGVVVNVIVADNPMEFGAIAAPDDVGIGWSFEGEQFHPPPPIDREPESPFHPLKPYQFWGAVRATGHEPALKAWVEAITDPVQKGIASAMLEYSLEFRREHPLIEAARVHLEMTEGELNDLWLWGLTL